MDPEKVLLILRERGDLSTEGRGDEDLGVFLWEREGLRSPGLTMGSDGEGLL